MSDFEQQHKQVIAEQNKELIDDVRKNANKPKKSNKWITKLWVAVMIVFTIGAIVGIYFATRPVPDDDGNIINITVNSDSPEQNSAQLNNLQFPQDIVNYSLFVCNDKQSTYDVYFRFSANTVVNGVVEENILSFIMASENASKFFYDETQDTWYYLDALDINEKITICSQVKIKPTADNSYADKSVGFGLTVEAIKADSGIVWLDASQQWLELMGISNEQ